METLSQKEFEKRYGLVPGLPKQKPDFKERTKEAFKAGIATSKEGISQVKEPGVMQKITGGLKVPVGIGRAIISPVSAGLQPIVEPTIGRGIQKTVDVISDVPIVQRIAQSKIGQKVDPFLEITALTGELAGYVAPASRVAKIPKAAIATREVALASAKQTALASAKQTATQLKKVPGVVAGGAAKVGKKAVQTLEKTPKGQQAVNVGRALVPSKERMINSELAKAFNMTQKDVSDFYLSNRTDLGRFMVNNNLIKDSVGNTQKALQQFKATNYKTVRDEIAKVDKIYTTNEVPYYKTALKTIAKDINKPGMEKSAAEVNSLLRKNKFTLNDIQRTKELIDKQYNLYKASGDPLLGSTKEGLRNMRSEIRGFLENEVKKNTGANIKAMNANVAAADDIISTITERATRGLTRANLSLGDYETLTGGGIGGAVVGGPLGALTGGAAALILKKSLENPEIRLMIARWLANRTPELKIKILNDLKANKIPTEMQPIIPQLEQMQNKFVKNPATGTLSKSQSRFIK